MTHHSSSDERLITLIYELLDAHADTVELALGAGDLLRWEAHLDYLLALQRTARTALAHLPPSLAKVPTGST